MKTNFLGQAYASRSPILASQTAINIYPEFNETTGSGIGGFYGTPGLENLFQGEGEVRGLWVTRNLSLGGFWLYGVIGNTVYRFDQHYSPQILGVLPNSSGHVSLADNGTQVAIAHPSGWHYVDAVSGVLAPVAGAPGGAILGGEDNYVLFTEESGGQFGLTNLGDVATLDPLDIATAEGAPDDTVSLLTDHREAWLFGTETIEIWSDTGAAFFPFERAPGGFIEQGICAPRSAVKIDNSVMWLGRDKNGRGIVYRANAYIPVRVSTLAVEHAIAQWPDPTDAFAYAYQEEGHTFYVLSSPSGDETWVYDVSASSLAQMAMWHQRYWMDEFGVLHRHRGNCYAQFYGDHVVGDWQNGKLYRMSLDLTDDDGQVIYRERAWEIESEEHKKIRLDEIELVALAGEGESETPKVWLKVSKDAGRQWGFERYQTLGNIGQRKTRARWRRAGSGRDLVLRVATTTRSKVSWVGANVRGTELAR